VVDAAELEVMAGKLTTDSANADDRDSTAISKRDVEV
jgi:hypothetical protein